MKLGRREPKDFIHVEKYPYGAIQPLTVTTVETVLRLPRWHKSHNQAQTNSCVGHGVVMERAITNARQQYLLTLLFPTKRYDPIYLWNVTKDHDYWPETHSGDNEGTAVSSAYDVARTYGISAVRSMKVVDGWPQPVGYKEPTIPGGDQTTRWATTVDQMRTSIANKQAVTIGTNWYTSMFYPTQDIAGESWLKDGNLGAIEGGHCTCIYGASDRRQAFKLKNSWLGWPEVWITYTLMGRLLNENGEAALITDK